MGPDSNPVVFVHGCYPGPPLAPPPYVNEGAANWGAFLGYFSAHGYPADWLHVWIYDGPVCGDIADMANDLEAFIEDVEDLTGEDDVDLVAHSMAGLTVRRLIAQHTGDPEIENVAILAGSNHGTFAAQFGDQWQAQFGYPAYEGARQMFPPYACDGQSPGNIQSDLNGCLTPTGRTVAADETPGDSETRYLNIYLTNDEINVPQHSACLNQEFIGDCSDPVNVAMSHVQPAPDGSAPAHVLMLFDPIVVDSTFVHLQYDD